ncbi:MAG: transposase [Bryobacteraceae bacterium]|nr:transposase [Bryobacteraceae bacterium]
MPQQLHAALIASTQKDPPHRTHRSRFHRHREARERVPEALLEQKRQNKKRGKTKRKKAPCVQSQSAERGTRIQRQRRQKLDTPCAPTCLPNATSAPKISRGHDNHWRGYKLHLDVADGQIPISALLTSASVHDSQTAIPLMTMTSQRVQYLYELMDSAYDANEIHQHCLQLEHVPIIVHGSAGRKTSPLTKARANPPRTHLGSTGALQRRTMSERVNARLKDEFGARQIRVRGAAKVMAHLMYGVLALTVDQWMKLADHKT